jgi:DNA-binding CsgD family transcriptional regulator
MDVAIMAREPLKDLPPGALTPRQKEVARLVTDYYSVAGELPSAGWLARRLDISRQRALVHVETLRRKRWLDRLQ